MTSSVSSLRTNVTARQVSSNLSRNTEDVADSRVRIASGNKLIKPLSDVGNFSMSIRLATAVTSATSTTRNLQNLLSFSQTQESCLRELTKVMLRMNELVTQVMDPLKMTSDKASYMPELAQLTQEVIAIGKSTFNGIDLFAGSSYRDTQVGLVGNTPNPDGSVGFTPVADSKQLDISVNLDGSSKVSVTKHALHTDNIYTIAQIFSDASDPVANLAFLDSSNPYTDASYCFPGAVEEVNQMLAKNSAEQMAVSSALAGNTQYATDLSNSVDGVKGTDVAKESLILSKLNLINQSAITVFSTSNQSNAYLLKLL